MTDPRWTQATEDALTQMLAAEVGVGPGSRVTARTAARAVLDWAAHRGLLVREGICGAELPRLLPLTPAGVCELTHGHRSEWHETPNEDGSTCRWKEAQP